MPKKISQDELGKKLINTYIDCVVVDDGVLCYEETLCNLSREIFDKMTDVQQKSIFGKIFESYDDCYNHLEKFVPSLRYELDMYTIDY